MAIFNILIQTGFSVISKIKIGDLCKPFHDIIIIPFPFPYLNLKGWKRRKITLI